MMSYMMSTRGEFVGRKVLMDYRGLMELKAEPERSALDMLLSDLAEYVGSDVFEQAAATAITHAQNKEKERQEAHPF